MKYLLILHMCSFLTQTCPGMMYPNGLHDTWLQCSQEGYKKAAELINSLDPDVVNANKIAIKFECKEIDPNTPV